MHLKQPLHSLTYRYIAPLLCASEQQFHCIFFDTPGAGFSRGSEDHDYIFTWQAQTFTDALMAMGIQRYSLVAHDTGGSIARFVAAIPENKGRITKMVLIDTELAYHPPPSVREFQWFARFSFAKRNPIFRFF